MLRTYVALVTCWYLGAATVFGIWFGEFVGVLLTALLSAVVLDIAVAIFGKRQLQLPVRWKSYRRHDRTSVNQTPSSVLPSRWAH